MRVSEGESLVLILTHFVVSTNETKKNDTKRRTLFLC